MFSVKSSLVEYSSFDVISLDLSSFLSQQIKNKLNKKIIGANNIKHNIITKNLNSHLQVQL